jgi:hypothetical protein
VVEDDSYILKIYKRGKFVGPKIDGFFKAVAEPMKDGGVSYLVESLDAKESWLITLAADDVQRIINTMSLPT